LAEDIAEYRGVVTDTIGAADDADIVDFLGAVMDVQRMISALTQPVERKYAISDRALGIIFLVHAGLDRPGLLHEYLNVLRSTITSDVDELVAAGLLRRKRSDTDRRVTRIEVTSKGARVQRETLRQRRSSSVPGRPASPSKNFTTVSPRSASSAASRNHRCPTRCVRPTTLPDRVLKAAALLRHRPEFEH
jgi:DNA-binding MarR family transcriptional regulator